MRKFTLTVERFYVFIRKYLPNVQDLQLLEFEANV
jgi:hypothetical protein